MATIRHPGPGTGIHHRRRLASRVRVSAATQWSAGLLTTLLLLILARSSGSGGISETIPTDWVAVTPGPGAEIVQFIKDLPHDASPLGLRAAHQRTKPTPATFRDVRFTSTDGTPLAGILGLGVNADTAPRPGIVLVPGFSQTSNHKYIVELADLFQRNGWNVLAIDLRGHGVSRTLSSAMITGGWKEAGDIIGAARFLRATTGTASVAVMGFSDGGRALVKAMADDGGQDIAAGIAVTAPLGPTTPATPPPPGFTPSPIGQYFLNFLGASTEYEYYDRAARSYGVDLRTMEARTVAEVDIAQVKAPLLLLYATDDMLWLGHVREGQHDGGSFSLAYRDRVATHSNVRTLLVDRGNHAGMLYLSDPYWFGLAVLNYLKYWQARDVPSVTTSVPPLDIVAEGTLAGQVATYRLLIRNHGTVTVGPMDLSVDLPVGARLEQCWIGTVGIGRCAANGTHLTWTVPTLAGGNTTAGPFGVTVDVSALSAGRFEVNASIDHPAVKTVATRQEVWLTK
jgi:pimeloyl-ACP methyl ester carboxylesterase